MSEALERALAREAMRLDPSITNPPVVRSPEDIKRVLAELDPASNRTANQVMVHAKLQGLDEQNKPRVYSVSAPTKSRSKRDILLEGMQIAKNRAEAGKTSAGDEIYVNGEMVRPAAVANAVDARLWVDPLIERWLNARRRGLMIYWELADGHEYRYDIFAHRLTRVAQCRK